jgi:hypothetical protein
LWACLALKALEVSCREGCPGGVFRVVCRRVCWLLLRRVSFGLVACPRDTPRRSRFRKSAFSPLSWLTPRRSRFRKQPRDLPPVVSRWSIAGLLKLWQSELSHEMQGQRDVLLAAPVMTCRPFACCTKSVCGFRSPWHRHLLYPNSTR